MSLAGFKKQINKANQFVSEKIGGAKGTELDNEFVEMERRADVMGKLVDELMARTHEVLQPNPASRAKLSTMNSISKMRGQAKSALYPQPEGQLGECMMNYGKELGDDSMFGETLTEAGEAYRQLAEIKYSLEDNVKQNFIEPLQHLQGKDLKEVNYLRKKLAGRRLDYDCKRRKQHKAGSHIPEMEIHDAEEKFAESKELAEAAMFNLLDNDVEQISQLSSLIDAKAEYHRQAADIMQNLSQIIHQKCSQAASRPRREHVPRRITSFSAHDKNGSLPDVSHSGMGASHGSLQNATGYSLSPASTGPPAYSSLGGASRTPTTPCCKALYDFEPENDGELGFSEGDVITLLARIDENWYEGEIHSRVGYFPVNYVKVIVDVQ